MYTQFCPPFPPVKKPEFYAFWRVVYYLNWYGLVINLSQYALKRTQVKLDQNALKGILVFCKAKLIFYIFLINKDLPTYINCLNSKKVDLIFTVILWIVSISIWWDRFNLKKMFRHARRL